MPTVRVLAVRVAVIVEPASTVVRVMALSEIVEVTMCVVAAKVEVTIRVVGGSVRV